MSNNIEVHIRINPLVKNNVWKYTSTKLSRIQNNREIVYENFVNILCNENNQEIYEKCLTSKIMEPENCTVFAYGQTGSGKTYTMLGDNYNGMIIYSIIDLLKYHEIKVSYIEIYNERIFDLNTGTELKIYSIDTKTVINDLSKIRVKTKEEGISFLEACEKNRRYGSTEYNLKSSRSHTIFQITYPVNDREININLIDLAGSEKACKNDSRRTEGAFINKSLLALCTVVNNLKNRKYFGFRDSKLTRLLQSSLNGETNIIALCTLSPGDGCIEESVSTLSFAARLANLELKKINIPLSPEKKSQKIDLSNFTIHKINLKRGFYLDQFLKLNMTHIIKDEESLEKEMLIKTNTKDDKDEENTNNKIKNFNNKCIIENKMMYDLEHGTDYSRPILNAKPFSINIDSSEKMKHQSSIDNKHEEIKLLLERIDSSEKMKHQSSIDNKHEEIKLLLERIDSSEKMKHQSSIDNKHEEIKLLLERIDSLEKMIHNMLKKNPSKRMKDIFVLEKHMFNLKYKKFENQI
ncbi:hypothetical protein P3W45_000453 [Vairimorpha bombi]